MVQGRGFQVQHERAVGAGRLRPCQAVESLCFLDTIEVCFYNFLALFPLLFANRIGLLASFFGRGERRRRRQRCGIVFSAEAVANLLKRKLLKMYLRLFCWLAVATVLIGIVAPMTSSTVRAADNGAAAKDEGDGAAEEETSQSAVWWFLKSSGLIGLVIFGLSIYFVALVVRMFMTLQLELAVPLDVATDYRTKVQQNNFQAAYDSVRNSDSFLGRVVAKGIEHLPNGLPEARTAMERTGDAETVRMEKQISMMAVLGTLGPMIGLIGTLKGMIASFSVIAMSGVSLKASEVAGGISEALLLTFEGVSLSVPAIYFFAFFRNRIATISTDAMLEADDLLHLFFRSGRGRTTTPQSPTIQTSPQRV